MTVERQNRIIEQRNNNWTRITEAILTEDSDGAGALLLLEDEGDGGVAPPPRK